MYECRLLSSTWIAATLTLSAVLAAGGCERKPSALAADPKTAVAPSTSTVVADGKLAIAEPKPKLKPGAKTKVLEAAGDRPYDKTFDDLRFEIAVGQPFKPEMLPAKIAALKDQRIRIRGFILPTAQARGIKTFVLVRDNQVCCFGPGAALYDCILVEMEGGKSAEFSILPVTVEGMFDVQEVRGPDGVHLAIYHLAAESVK